MNTIKIIIADDHPLFLKGLKDTLSDEEDFEILGTAKNGVEALEIINDLNPDVVTLDIDMPLLNGINVAKQLLIVHPNIKIIILSMHKDADIIKASMDIGIHAYVFKDDAANDLVNAIRSVYAGGIYISSTIPNLETSNPISEPLLQSLTKMERIILIAIGKQKTSKQIADEHFISVKTVDNHRANIVKKLNLKGNNSLLKFALSGYLN
ncbi:MAG TPA: response regulator transcription factor [Saprospiraceae bacterium]|nr:response regulator transcription factor [Saprospiraceae bacterium]